MPEIKGILALLLVSALAGLSCTRGSGNAAGAQAAAPGGGAQQGAQRGGGGGRGFAPAAPMTVELAAVGRADLSERTTVVGNLIGANTVEVVPKVSGRLEEVFVRLGDRVRRGQAIAKVEDRELLEQIKQAEASYAVSQATIRQREADLMLTRTNVERSRSLFARQLVPQQTLDDVEARHQAAEAQLDLARAQFDQAKARIDELKINLANTTVASPLDGFVGKRVLDRGAWVTPNSEFVSLVDIHVVRLVANVVEKDLRRVVAGAVADVEVDAYPGEAFTGRVARVAPVLDPATRTAQIEVEIQNDDFRLKPGMYARVRFTVEQRQQVMTVPIQSLVDVNGRRGVFRPEGDAAKFYPVSTGIEERGLVEISQGLQEGDRVITTGAAGLREGDRILLASGRASRPGGGGGEGGGPPAGGFGSRGSRGQAPMPQTPPPEGR